MDFISGLFPIVVMVLLVILLIKYLGGSRLTQDQIVEQWTTLVGQGSGNADDVYNVITDVMKSAEPPGVTWSRQEIHAGGLLYGKKYDGLRVNNPLLRDYKIYIFVYDYGTSLHVAWFMTFQKVFLRRVQRMDIPQQLELSAYAQTVHSATKNAVQVLMEKLEQDFSKVNTRTKGFLEFW